MYSLAGIRKGLARPRLVAQEVNRLYHRRLHTRSYNDDGLDLLEADWDNLFILDACRSDLFERTADLPGETTRVRSRGSQTREFLRGTLDGRSALDTVYVTASPMLHRHDDVRVRFHDVVDVWRDRGWDEQYRTVMPETVADAAIEAAERYPDKRLLVHFLQPHYPFVGPTGREHFDLDRLDFRWDDLADGTLDVPEGVVRRSYEENLEEVLPSVDRLFAALGGRSVVTSDHGQMLGERAFPVPIREYGHPAGIYTDELVEVPWHVHEAGPRRDIVAEEPPTRARHEEADAEADADVVRQRLRELGYVQ